MLFHSVAPMALAGLPPSQPAGALCLSHVPRPALSAVLSVEYRDREAPPFAGSGILRSGGLYFFSFSYGRVVHGQVSILSACN